MKKWLKALGKFAAEVVIITAIIMLVKIATEGMYLIGIPSQEAVSCVKVSYPRVTAGVKEFGDAEKIDLAVSLFGFLKYSVFEKNSDGEPLMTITYVLKNGREVSVSVNRSTLWWNGKVHALKREDVFINLAERIFFSEELAGKCELTSEKSESR